ncbi:MAG: CBS domain-containing protein [Promethearchaeota archaeon]|nr:MAG: CBS domain-containing protein [Candidatus Lokiarchaeota archaeon]
MEDRLKELSKIKVSKFMIKEPLFTLPNEKISTTELLMVRKNIGGIPVVENRKKKQLIGIITQRDIRLARFAMNLNSPNTTVKDLMTVEPFAVKKDDTLMKVLEIMFENKIQRLPVVKEGNELIGLILRNEILKKVLEYMKK